LSGGGRRELTAKAPKTPREEERLGEERVDRQGAEDAKGRGAARGEEG
jgi:hypothetical protein